jgi:DNA-directed RNA polymerase specialized sigma subunit
MTDELTGAIYRKLSRITASNSYLDTAQQIADHLRHLGFETSTWQRVQELERELEIAKSEARSLRLQWKAQEVRKARKSDN